VPGNSEQKWLNAVNRKIILSTLMFGALLAVFDSAAVSSLANTAYAESGIGKDVFKVIVSIFGATKQTGDFVTTVTVNDQSKVRAYDVQSTNLPSDNSNSSTGDNTLEFVAAFPNVVVNTGDKYRACVLTLINMHQYCEEGANSPAKRPEFVDISLDKALKIPDSGKKSKLKD
jgi:hypothetical protein